MNLHSYSFVVIQLLFVVKAPIIYDAILICPRSCYAEELNTPLKDRHPATTKQKHAFERVRI